MRREHRAPSIRRFFANGWETTELTRRLQERGYTENDVPQPQERAELGLMKLNPWRISVSS